MDFDFPADDDPRRTKIRDWLADNPRPTPRDLLARGLIVPHWPAPYGLGADPMHQIIISQELSRAGVGRPINPIGIGWAAPTILQAGTEETEATFPARPLCGEDIYCQMFSEPDAGSDLAALSTRAVRDGDEYVINGSKTWTSGGHWAKYGILIARTNPDAPKHKGISYFVCPTDLPGLEMRPVIDMTTAHSFNETFFDDVRLPAEYLIGVGERRLATRQSHARQRTGFVELGRIAVGGGAIGDQLIDLIRDEGGLDDPVMRDRAARAPHRGRSAPPQPPPNTERSAQRQHPGTRGLDPEDHGDEHGQHVMELAKDLAGTEGMLAGSGPKGALPASMQAGQPR